jgi:hypothetical protein
MRCSFQKGLAICCDDAARGVDLCAKHRGSMWLAHVWTMDLQALEKEGGPIVLSADGKEGCIAEFSCVGNTYGEAMNFALEDSMGQDWDPDGDGQAVRVSRIELDPPRNWVGSK